MLVTTRKKNTLKFRDVNETIEVSENDDAKIAAVYFKNIFNRNVSVD